jgi:hypothetical protein
MIRFPIVIAMLATMSFTDFDYTSVVCMQDSSGVSVQLWGTDTSVVFKNVVKVVYGSGGFVVYFKDGKTVTMTKPPFRKVDLVTESPEESDTTKAPRKEKDRKEEKERKSHRQE